MKKNGLELEIWEFRLWARVSYRWLCTGAGGQDGGVEGAHSARPGWFSVLQAPPRLSIPLTQKPPYIMTNPEPDGMSP